MRLFLFLKILYNLCGDIMDLIIGSHVSFNNKDQLIGSVKEAVSYNANTFMFYTGPAQSTMRSEIDDNITYEAYKLMVDNNINSNNVVVHAPYIVNLANRKDEDKFMFYVNFLAEELSRVKKLGFDKIVLHPGSAVGCTREEGLKNISDGVNLVFDKSEDTKILLEFMAGKGNELGTSIDELKTIIDNIKNQDRIKVCLDTCHMNDAGIDLNYFDEFLDEFDKKIGLSKIECIHINDSMNQIAAHKDRHQNIGYGTIGFELLNKIVHNPRLESIPKILETPWVNRNQPNEYPPYKFEIENFRNEKFTDFIQ